MAAAPPPKAATPPRSLNVPVPRPSSVLRQLLLTQSKQRIRHGGRDIGDIAPSKHANTLPASACCQCRVLGNQGVQDVSLLVSVQGREDDLGS